MRRIVSIAALASASLPGLASAQTPPVLSGTRLDVVARGEVTRVPDVAIISAGVVTQAKDARGALTANAAMMARVLAALKRAGVEARDIATANINLSAQYRYGDNQPPVVTGYQANNSVTIRFRDIAKSGAILDTLVAEGANQINGPSLVIDKPATALDEARMLAMGVARQRAELYAKAAGLSVKRIVSISEAGDEQGARPYPIMVTARSADAAQKTEIAPGEQEIGITLAVTFELN